MEVLLIRHGQTEPLCDTTPTKEAAGLDGGWPDGSLTALGQRQASALQPRMAAFAPQRVLCSDLARARCTAELACAGLDVRIEQMPALREIHMGRMHRQNWEALSREDPAFCEAWHAHREDLPYPGGESGDDTAARAWPVLETLAAQNVERAAIFCHGGTIRVLLCRALGLPPQRRFALGPFENTSVSTLRHGPHGWSLYASNDYAHLQGLQ